MDGLICIIVLVALYLFLIKVPINEKRWHGKLYILILWIFCLTSIVGLFALPIIFIFDVSNTTIIKGFVLLVVVAAFTFFRVLYLEGKQTMLFRKHR